MSTERFESLQKMKEPALNVETSLLVSHPVGLADRMRHRLSWFRASLKSANDQMDPSDIVPIGINNFKITNSVS